MEAKELRNQVINKLWSFDKLPKKIQALMTDNEVEFMLEVINVYVAEQLAIDSVVVPKGTLCKCKKGFTVYNDREGLNVCTLCGESKLA